MATLNTTVAVNGESMDTTILTRPPIPHTSSYVHIESCLVSDANEDIVLAVILLYGLILTTHLILKGMRTFHKYKMQNEEYEKMLFCDRIGLFFADFLNKRNIYFIIFLHIWNQATDIGVIVEMYYLSFSVCTIEFTLLYRLFALGLAFMLFYRFTTAILTIYATQQPLHFFYQLTDLLLIKNLELNYIFSRKSIDSVQVWIVYCSCCLQSFPIMLISMGIMTLTQGYAEHPVLLCSAVISFILCTYSICTNDRIIYYVEAHKLQLSHWSDWSYQCLCKLDNVMTGYCCECDAFRIEYVYRILFRCFDFQFRIFILIFIWIAIGGVYLAAYLLIEFLILYSKARKIGRYQLLSGLLGIVINYTSPQAKKFSARFSYYRFITNYLLLIIVFIAVSFSGVSIPVSDPFEQRKSDFSQTNVFALYIYLCVLSLLNPWLYFGCVRGGELIRDDKDAATNPRDPHCIIANKDFPTFLQLIVFKNKFYHGNEWVLQHLLNAIEENIFRIPPKYLILLLECYAWDFTKISYYTKSKFFASIMRFNDIELIKLLFDKMSDCNDIKGVESGLLYWCQTKNFKHKHKNKNGNKLTFLRIIKLIESKFEIRKLNVLVQSQLLKYTILRAADLGDLVPFHGILTYSLNDKTLSHLYLHYKDLYDTNISKQVFADILLSLHHVKNFKFNVDNNSAKCFLFWALKFELWETVNELLAHKHASKQVYSTYSDNMPFLHLVCKTKTHGTDISDNICNIADICLNKLYSSLNQQRKENGITILMYACQMLHVSLIQTILKYGADIDICDNNGNDCKWYIEHNYYTQNVEEEEEKGKEEFEGKELENTKKAAYALLNNSEQRDEEFIELYEEKYGEFYITNESIPLYRSTKTDLNALFEAIKKQDFQRIITLIDTYNLDVNMPTINGRTPLHFACQHSGALITKFLLDRGAYPFNITDNTKFAIDLMELNHNLDDNEREFMKRLLDVKDVDHDPFALTDERVIEVERIQLFAQIFIKYMLILFVIFIATFVTSAGLTDRFKIGYVPPL